MRREAPPRIRVRDTSDANRQFDRIHQWARRLNDETLLGGNLVRVNLQEGYTRVIHGLGRAPQGWFVVDPPKGLTLYRSSWGHDDIVLGYRGHRFAAEWFLNPSSTGSSRAFRTGDSPSSSTYLSRMYFPTRTYVVGLHLALGFLSSDLTAGESIEASAQWSSTTYATVTMSEGEDRVYDTWEESVDANYVDAASLDGLEVWCDHTSNTRNVGITVFLSEVPDPLPSCSIYVF